MPEPSEILSGLSAISNKYITIAIIWHVLFYLFLLSLLFKKRLPSKLTGYLFCLPLCSVALFAWFSGNMFNGITFSALAVLMILFCMRSSSCLFHFSPWPFIIIGILMVLFGLVYPHFLENRPLIAYAYSSPVGLIPCPTLSVLIGFLLMFNGLESKNIQIAFVAFGLFYGIFGVFRLGVIIDVALIIGSLALLILVFLRKKASCD